MTRILVLFLVAALAPSLAIAQEAPAPASDEAFGAEDVSRYFDQRLEFLDEDLLETSEPADLAEDAPESDALAALPIEEAFQQAQIAFALGEYPAARIYAETAAIGGHARSATLAGIIARLGLAGPADPAAALRWFSRAADQDEPVALYELGRMAQAEEAGLAPLSARTYFQRAAQAGHIEAMVAYALVLKRSPVPNDKDEALVWAERAALQGSAEGMYQYAIMLDGWPYGPQSVPDALIWYRRAADGGHVEAAFEAALILAEGVGGVEPDAGEAFDRMRLAAESGYAPAEGQYGLMLLQGFAGEVDETVETEAAAWIRQGAEGGDPESQFLFALLVGRGTGVRSDFEEAYFWALHAAHDSQGAPVYNPERDRFQAVLENDLPPSVVERVRQRVRDTGGVVAE